MSSQPTGPADPSLYGPCAPAVCAVLGRASGLVPREIIGLAEARELYGDPDLWNAAIDALAAAGEACGRRETLETVSAEAQRMTWLAATTAAHLPDLARTHVTSHGPAFSAATETAARMAAVAAMSAALADRLSPSVSAILSAPWRAVTESSRPTPGAIS